MTYTKQTWVAGQAGGTPISAPRLNYMEQGISDANDAVRTGAGSPEGSVTAPIGVIYTDNTSGLVYSKGSGTGNTGWVLVSGSGGGGGSSLLTALGWVNVTDAAYGATGNGTTNDQPAIQAAINAAGPRGVVYFPKTTATTRYYRIDTPLTPLVGQTLVGCHTPAYDSDEFILSQCAIRAGSNFTGSGLIIFNTSTNNVDVKIHNLAIIGPGESFATSTIDGIFMGAVTNNERNWLISQCNISACPNRAVGGHMLAMEFRDSFFGRCNYSFNPVAGEQMNDVHIITCKIYWNKSGGIYINSTGGGSGAVAIIGCRIERNGATPNTNATVNRNTDARGIYIGNGHNITIVGNITDGNTGPGLFIESSGGSSYSITATGNQFIRDGGGDLATPTDNLKRSGVMIRTNHVQFTGNVIDSGDPSDSGVAGTGLYPYYGLTLDGADMCNIANNRIEIAGQSAARAINIINGGASYIYQARWKLMTVPYGSSVSATGPALAFAGLTYFDTANNLMRTYHGGIWKDSSQYVIGAKTGAGYTLVAGDAGTLVELNNATAITLTVPANASVAFPTGTTIELLQTNTGQVTVVGAAGVTVNARAGLKLVGQWSQATLVKRASNTWVLSGDLSA